MEKIPCDTGVCHIVLLRNLWWQTIWLYLSTHPQEWPLCPLYNIWPRIWWKSEFEGYQRPSGGRTPNLAFPKQISSSYRSRTESTRFNREVLASYICHHYLQGVFPYIRTGTYISNIMSVGKGHCLGRHGIQLWLYPLCSRFCHSIHGGSWFLA
jgi:hypothetical protein